MWYSIRVRAKCFNQVRTTGAYDHQTGESHESRSQSGYTGADRDMRQRGDRSTGARIRRQGGFDLSSIYL